MSTDDELRKAAEEMARAAEAYADAAELIQGLLGGDAGGSRVAPTIEVSGPDDETAEEAVEGAGDEWDLGLDERTRSYYTYPATGYWLPKGEYDELYELTLSTRKQVEQHAMYLQLAQNMAALQAYETDAVANAEAAIDAATYDPDRPDETGLNADWGKLLGDLRDAMGIGGE
jgi:hypothetical protein